VHSEIFEGWPIDRDAMKKWTSRKEKITRSKQRKKNKKTAPKGHKGEGKAQNKESSRITRRREQKPNAAKSKDVS